VVYHVIIQIGADGVSAHKYSKNSLEVWALRCVDLTPEMRGKVRCHRLFALATNQPPTPKCMRPYLSELYDFLGKYSSGPGFPVVDARCAAAGLDPNVCVNVLWLAFSGDTPMVSAAMNARGHNAYWGCIFCFFTGWYERAIFFLGYKEAKVQQYGVAPSFHVDAAGVFRATKRPELNGEHEQADGLAGGVRCGTH
jgi:hypothetical protein